MFFCGNEEVYVSEEVKENALDSHQRENHADQKYTICVSRPLSMKQAAKIMHNCSVVIYPLEKKFTGTSSILARGISRVLPTDPLYTLHMRGSNWNSSDFP